MQNDALIEKLKKRGQEKPSDYQSAEDLFEMLRIYETENSKSANESQGKTKLPANIMFAGSFKIGDPYGNRTHDSAVKGRRLDLLTNGPYGSGSGT